MRVLVVVLILGLLTWFARGKRLDFFSIVLLALVIGALLSSFVSPLWALGAVLFFVMLLPNR